MGSKPDDDAPTQAGRAVDDGEGVRVLAELRSALGMRLRLLPAGRFRMGSPAAEDGRSEDEGPPHEVSLPRAFYLGVYPVTQREYEAVTGTNPARFHAGNGGGPDHPVEYVSWEDAVAFCQALSARPEERATGQTYRLPTEAEWEYACRAGTTTAFHVGDALAPGQANFDARYPYGGAAGVPVGRTTPVGGYPPNGWGLYDLHGNVWEWCADWYDDHYYRASPGEAPEGPATGRSRVVRGGCQGSHGYLCRSANRDRNQPALRTTSRDIGFRVALEARPGTP